MATGTVLSLPTTVSLPVGPVVPMPVLWLESIVIPFGPRGTYADKLANVATLAPPSVMLGGVVASPGLSAMAAADPSLGFIRLRTLSLLSLIIRRGASPAG